jgi:hypothetical protein
MFGFLLLLLVVQCLVGRVHAHIYDKYIQSLSTLHIGAFRAEHRRRAYHGYWVLSFAFGYLVLKSKALGEVDRGYPELSLEENGLCNFFKRY